MSIGTLVELSKLDPHGRTLVEQAWEAVRNAYCPLTNSPVGCAIRAQNNDGPTLIFQGCNVENSHFPCTICAERVSAVKAVSDGAQRFRAVAVVYPSLAGRLPCGICRQVLAQFGDATAQFLSMVGPDTVRCLRMGDLLPAAAGPVRQLSKLDGFKVGVVQKVLGLKALSPVPELHNPRGACVLVPDGNLLPRMFDGRDGFHGRGAAHQRAELVAVEAARQAGFTPKNKLLTLAVTIADPTAANPIDGQSLYVLDQHEANDAIIWLIGPDGSLVESSLRELYPC